MKTNFMSIRYYKYFFNANLKDKIVAFDPLFANFTVLALSIMAEIKPITLCWNFSCLSQHHDVKCQHSTIVGTKYEKHFGLSI